MNVETVGYCCTRAEWETLFQLLQMRPPVDPGMPPQAEEVFKAAYDTLCETGILTPSGEHVLVDPLFAFLLSELSQSRHCLVMRSEDRHVHLYSAPEIALLCEWTPSHCTITPFPNASQARAALSTACQHCSIPAVIEYVSGDTLTDSREVKTHEDAAQALHAMYNRFCLKQS